MKKTLFLAALILNAPVYASWGGGYNTAYDGTRPTKLGNLVLYYGNGDNATATVNNLSGHTEEVDGLNTFYIAPDRGTGALHSDWTGTLTVNMADSSDYAINVIQHPWRDSSADGFTNLNVTTLNAGTNFHFNVLAKNTVTLNTVNGVLNSVVRGHDGSIEGTATLKTTKDTTFNSLTLGEGGQLQVMSGTTEITTLTKNANATLKVDENATVLLKATAGQEWASLEQISGSGHKGYSLNGNFGDDGLLLDAVEGDTVKLNGVTGILGGSGATIVAKDLILTNPGLAAANFSTIKGDSYTFNGSISGNGNFIFGQANKEVTVTLNGDLSGWETSNDSWGGFRNSAGEVTVNMNYEGIVKAAFNVHTLNIGANATLNKYISVTDFSVAAGKEVATKGHFAASNVRLESGASLTLDTSAASRTIESLTLSNGATITLSYNNSHDNKALVTTNLTVNGNSTMNADLVMNNGTMTFADNTTLTMGCSVTIGNGTGDTPGTVTVVLTDEMVQTIKDGGRVDLFTDVETATLGEHIVFTGANGALEQSDVYALKYDEVSKTIYATPEPATATLSLLALAGLAARRRRH